jgi:hypothetical protein
VAKVKIKEGTSPENIENQVAEVTGITSMTITGLDLAQRHYFRVKGGSGDGVTAAERDVPQIGVLNFRDIGGYSTVPNGGGNVKSVDWGSFFRGAARVPNRTRAFLRTWV